MDIPTTFIQTDNPKSGRSNRYYKNKRQTGTYPCGYRSRSLLTLYQILEWKKSAIPGITKTIVWNINGIINILPKVE